MAGVGSLRKVGTGTITLSGWNTYDGSTSNGFGTVQADTGSIALTMRGTLISDIFVGSIALLNPIFHPIIINGFVSNRTDILTLNNPDAYTGTLSVLGGGSIYTGNTTINGATLNFASYSMPIINTSATMVVGSGTIGNTTVASINSSTLGGSSGLDASTVGSLSKSGTGILTLNPDVYIGTGNGTIQGGTLSGTGGSGTITLNGGSLTAGTLQVLPNAAISLDALTGAGATTLDSASIVTPSLHTTSDVQGILTVGNGTEIVPDPLTTGTPSGPISLTAVPEPSTLALLVIAGLGLAVSAWRNWKNH
jgi:fibronectin-binding autotransporter adhesin